MNILLAGLSHVLKSWKTSLAGAIATVTPLVHYFLPQYEVRWQQVLVVLIGLGLIAAKDANVTGTGTTGN